MERNRIFEVEILDREAVGSLVPGIYLDDIAFGVLGRRDGYFDPYSILRGFVRKARALGAVYLEDEGLDIRTSGDRVIGVTGRRTGPVDAPVVVNAAGAWVRSVGEMAGVDVPVDPWRRQVYVIRPPAELPELPMVIDPTGLHFRSETGGFLLVARETASDASTFDIVWDHTSDKSQGGSEGIVAALSSRAGGSTQKFFLERKPSRTKKSKAIIVKVTW